MLRGFLLWAQIASSIEWADLTKWFQNESSGVIIGQSELNLPVYIVGERTSKILIVSGIHGNEVASVDISLLAYDLLKSQLGIDVSWIPVLNPDGFRKQQRHLANGTDLNRQFLSSKQLPKEAQLLHDWLVVYRPSLVLAVHSGTEAVFWPWGDRSTPHPRQDWYVNTARIIADMMRFSAAKQSYFDYPTAGELIDYVSRELGIDALTIEVSFDHQLSQNDLAMKATLFAKAIEALKVPNG